MGSMGRRCKKRRSRQEEGERSVRPPSDVSRSLAEAAVGQWRGGASLLTRASVSSPHCSPLLAALGPYRPTQPSMSFMDTAGIAAHPVNSQRCTRRTDCPKRPAMRVSSPRRGCPGAPPWSGAGGGRRSQRNLHLSGEHRPAAACRVPAFGPPPAHVSAVIVVVVAIAPAIVNTAAHSGVVGCVHGRRALRNACPPFYFNRWPAAGGQLAPCFCFHAGGQDDAGERMDRTGQAEGDPAPAPARQNHDVPPLGPHDALAGGGRAGAVGGRPPTRHAARSSQLAARSSRLRMHLLCIHKEPPSGIMLRVPPSCRLRDPQSISPNRELQFAKPALVDASMRRCVPVVR
ncbi:hypothetical protein BS50DRAFT_663977 [Corynespora cassiicola Philippines]|uniref:Uncharacterized protein n=1 Tax=Corynespora cassiicola Philippines TaxID=1448308 RepID=A0A2T2NUS0_CORCC|nr:hypothetical protein BS50DRAFT_663977 [Corynespora cassiicola Philippines]